MVGLVRFPVRKILQSTGILRLIDSLDLPTPQVVIEGRIVETFTGPEGEARFGGASVDVVEVGIDVDGGVAAQHRRRSSCRGADHRDQLALFFDVCL